MSGILEKLEMTVIAGLVITVVMIAIVFGAYAQTSTATEHRWSRPS